MASRTPGRNAQGRSRSAKSRAGSGRKSRGSNPWDRENPRSRSQRTRLTDEEVAKFTAQRYRFPGVEVQARLFRQYPYGKTAAHVIGYIGRISQRDAERIGHQFVDAEVGALVKYRIVRLAAQRIGEDVLDRDERGADEEDEKTAEEQHVSHTCEAASPHASLQEHVAHQPADGHLPVDSLAFFAPLTPKLHTARDAK